MTAHTQLNHQLKALKLPGIRENLDLRLMEAEQNHLAYSQFLALLLQDEIETRNMKRLHRLLRDAGLGNEKTLETFDLSFNASINAAHIRELSTGRFIERGEGLFLIGPTGTGKTHPAKALCHQACRRFFSVAFYPFHAFFERLRKAQRNDRIERLMKKLIKVDLLVIDDFGFKKIDQQDAESLYAIVDARDAAKSIILTSNRAITDWGGLFPDPFMANAILDRLAHHSLHIISKGESYRKKFRPVFQNARMRKTGALHYR